MSPRPAAEEQAEAIRLLMALATAKDADAITRARDELKDAASQHGWAWGGDPIGVPCPAETDRTLGLTLGCPSVRGGSAHVDGHGPRSLMSRMVHCGNVAKASWPTRKGGQS